MPNQRIQIPFGGSLGRDAGVMVMRPGSFEDQRNVILHEGKAIVRPGFGSELALYDDQGNQVSHVLQGHELRSERVGIVVSYQQSTKKVWVHRVSAEATTGELVGEWQNDRGGWGSTPPVISMAECYGRVFMAQDERLVTKRANTVYYDSVSGSNPLQELTAKFIEGTPPQLSIGVNDDTRVASEAFTYIIDGAPYTKDAAETALPAETIPSDHWAAYVLSVNALGAVAVSPAAGNTTGYTDEASAIAAAPSVPAGSSDMGYVTVEAPSGGTWTAGTDSLAGGASNAAQTTNYYQGTVGDESHTVRFRGVVRHLAYICGWGYGDESEDRPDYLRVSLPGDPTHFDPLHFFGVGDRNDAILGCRPAGAGPQANLVVCKQTEGYVMVGSSRNDFGMFLVDPDHGTLTGALMASFGAYVVTWSGQGPRVWDGKGASADIAIPLDLEGLEPSSLVPQGSTEYAFAHYVSSLRVVLFAFGQRVYALTVRKQPWEWAYWELGFTPYCAFTLTTGAQLAQAPTGYPEITAVDAGSDYAHVSITHHNQDGDETLEIWLQDQAGGSWYLAKSKVVPLDATEVVKVPVGGAGITYHISTRYRRGTLYATPYADSSDPWGWPTISRDTFTTGAAAPIPVSAVWSRVDASTEQILLTVTPYAGQEASDIKVLRDGVEVHTIPGPFTGDATWADQTIGGESEYDYTFVTAGSPDSPESDALTVWAGPTQEIPDINWVIAYFSSYEVSFTTPNSGLETEVWDNYDDATKSIGPYALRATAAAGETTAQSGPLTKPDPPGLELSIKVRQKATTFGVADYGQFSTTEDIVQ